MSKAKILIVGAGLGGLCLAQKLRRAGVDVAVFERDESPWDRPQGYRLHLDADGIDALRDALPPPLLALFEATSMKPVDSTTIIDTALNERKRVPSEEHGGGGGAKHMNVNRATVREIVLRGLEDICQFNASLDHYESDDNGVTAVFADGRRVRGDVLVGADGIHSRVRRQRAPDARVMDTGVRTIYGRMPIAAARAALPRHVLEDVFTVASDTRKVFLGLGPVIFPTRPEPALSKQDDYVVCIVGGRREYFGLDDAALHRLPGAELQRLAGELLKDWPAHAITTQCDPSSLFFVEMHTSVPCTLAPATNVTLLGDAIHAMTPTLGRGANLAMRDGARLGRALADALANGTPLAEALNAYEREMTAYSFEVVRESARMGERLIGQSPLPEA